MAYCNYALHDHPDVRAQSPFDEIHYPDGNETHIDINANNKRWFMRAVLEGFDTDGDGYDDYQEYLLGTAFDSAASKLEGATIQQPLVTAPDLINLSWNWRPNVSYKIYFTETLARDWILVETGYVYQNGEPPFTASCQFPRTTPTGFLQDCHRGSRPRDRLTRSQTRPVKRTLDPPAAICVIRTLRG